MNKVANTLKAAKEKKVFPINKFAKEIINHEGLLPHQTPFRITSPGMAKWQSMFDNTFKIELDPDFKKPKGRENFLYLKNKDDIVPAVAEQFRRYAERVPDITIEQAVRIFDQTGADGKIKYLADKGYDKNELLENLFV